MAFISSGDTDNQRCDAAQKRLDGTIKIVDDILIASETYEQHHRENREPMRRCTEHHPTLNPKKMELEGR